jgi:predicted transcriptional regulator/transcriptional regulator with XRE-family HTH domain
MRGPIGIRISSRRKSLRIPQADLARRAGISPSYLNLIEANKRAVGGALLKRIAEQLAIEIEDLTGEAEHRLIAELEEAFADPVLAANHLTSGDAADLVAQQPAAAAAIVALHRAYVTATASADDYAQRLRADPLFAQLLHRMLSGLTAVRSSAEILEDVPDLEDEQRLRFSGTIVREARTMTDVAQSLLGRFEQGVAERRAVSPTRELDDLIFRNDNYFPRLEAVAESLLREIGTAEEGQLEAALGKGFGVRVRRSAGREVDARGFPGQYHYDAGRREMWFQTATFAATRQFQLTRLYAELAAGDAIETELEAPELRSPASRRLAYRALSSYVAGAMVFPYERFLADAEMLRYDLEALRQAYIASFEQVAHRLVTLRKPGAAGIPFGFLRSDPAGRLTKHFPLPGLLLPNSGHACPLWAIYNAFRAPEMLVRQAVQFSDGSRYLFVAKASGRRAASFTDRAILTSVMLACDVLRADETVYGTGLDLNDGSADVPVGPACRLCTRRDCPERQEEALLPGQGQGAVRAPLVPRAFDQTE